MSNFYVYELWNPIKNEIFYVGKSQHKKYSNRLNDHISEAKNILALGKRGNHKLYTILKILKEGYHIDFRIVFETDDELLAFGKEIELIKFYGRRCNNNGPLTNLTDGGEGVSGYNAPDWLKKLRSENTTGDKNGMYGKNHTIESKQQISKVRTTRIKSGEIIPSKHTEEWKKHLKEDNAGGKATARPVYQIDHDGNILHTHTSSEQAALTIGKNASKGNIHLSASFGGRGKMPYGYFWRFVDDYDSKENFKEQFVKIEQSKRGKRLIQYDLNMNYIKTWDTIKEALIFYDMKAPIMSTKCFKMGKPYCESYWKLEL
jgi:hypothetical protein